MVKERVLKARSLRWPTAIEVRNRKAGALDQVPASLMVYEHASHRSAVVSEKENTCMFESIDQ